MVVLRTISVIVDKMQRAYTKSKRDGKRRLPGQAPSGSWQTQKLLFWFECAPPQAYVESLLPEKELGVGTKREVLWSQWCCPCEWINVG